jgi:hypothetical protein
LVRITTDMAAIWGACDGYTGVDAFPAFVRAHAHRPEAFYIAFREETVASIQAALHDRQRDARLVVQRPARRPLLRTIVRALPAALDIPRTIVRAGFFNVVRGVAKIIATLNRYVVFRIVNRLTGNRLPDRQSPFSSVAIDNCPPPMAGTPPSFREDVVTQNQLTLVTDVDPRAVGRVQAVMAAIDSYAKRLSPPGSLIGISTIHFVRWLLIDGNRRLMMLSDYDGSWENYIDEFAEMILSGLDAIWESSPGYPPDGARDLPAFKRFLRSHQVPAEIFFSAYPDANILNISQDVSRARG